MKTENPFNRLLVPFLLFCIMVVVGVIGYEVIEKRGAIDSLYMTFSVLSTEGHSDARPMSDFGKIFTIGLMICGVSTMAYAIGQFGEIIVEGKIFDYRRRSRMEKTLSNLKGHYVICGYGRVGHQVVADLQSEKIPVVVIDSKPETAQELEVMGIPYFIGSAASDDLLKKAGIDHAKAVMACADSDAENVFITLSAKSVNPKVFLVARAAFAGTEQKLRMAGADRVISPYFIAGRRMAAMAMRPIAIDYLDMVMHSEHLELSLHEFSVEKGSKVIGKSLQDANLRQQCGATILAIRKSDGGFNLQPIGTTVIEQGDVLVAIGTKDQLELMGKIV
jgi:voltage-gated potassium channel